MVYPLEGGEVGTAGGQVLLGRLGRWPGVDCIAHGSCGSQNKRHMHACAPGGGRPASKPLSAPCITCQAGLSGRLLLRAGAGANRTFAAHLRSNAMPGRSRVQLAWTGSPMPSLRGAQPA